MMNGMSPPKDTQDGSLWQLYTQTEQESSETGDAGEKNKEAGKSLGLGKAAVESGGLDAATGLPVKEIDKVTGGMVSEKIDEEIGEKVGSYMPK